MKITKTKEMKFLYKTTDKENQNEMKKMACKRINETVRRG